MNLFINYQETDTPLKGDSNFRGNNLGPGFRWSGSKVHCDTQKLLAGGCDCLSPKQLILQGASMKALSAPSFPLRPALVESKPTLPPGARGRETVYLVASDFVPNLSAKRPQRQLGLQYDQGLLNHPHVVRHQNLSRKDSSNGADIPLGSPRQDSVHCCLQSELKASLGNIIS